MARGSLRLFSVALLAFAGCFAFPLPDGFDGGMGPHVEFEVDAGGSSPGGAGGGAGAFDSGVALNAPWNPPPIEEARAFVDQFAARSCDLYQHCGFFRPDGRAHCIARYTESFDFDEAQFRSGVVLFDREAALEELSRVPDAAGTNVCRDLYPRPFGDDNGVLRYVTANRDGGLSCPPGESLFSIDAGCAGCVRVPREGEACDAARACAPWLRCLSASDGGSVCRARGEFGSTCQNGSECRSFHCQFDAGVGSCAAKWIQPKPSDGNHCHYPVDCSEGFGCFLVKDNDPYAESRCQALRDAGEPCGWSGASHSWPPAGFCSAGLLCGYEGKCGLVPETAVAGAPCEGPHYWYPVFRDTSQDPWTGLRCGVGDAGHLRWIESVQSRCGRELHCATRSVCLADGGVACRPALGWGEPCALEDSCETGLYCKPTIPGHRRCLPCGQ